MTTPKPISIPLALVFSLTTAIGGIALGAGVVRSDVGHLSERIAHVEVDVHAVSAELSALKLSHTGDAARDAQWRSDLERRLIRIETSQSSIATAVSELGTLIRSRRRR